MSDLQQHGKSRFPACNLKRRNEALATNSVLIDTPAVFTGSIKAARTLKRTSMELSRLPSNWFINQIGAPADCWPLEP
jgi:hypothetical protein